MKLHGNARTCPHSRLLMVRRVEEEGWTLARAAEAAGVSVRTVSKWLRCYRAEGEEGLFDRSSAPRTIPHRTPDDRVQAIACLRRLRFTGAEIAEALRMPLSTVSAILTRIGLGRLSRLEPPEPARRYQRSRPGELVHNCAYGIQVERVMTDNGSAYVSVIHALACRALGIKHLRTRPYRPRTNGKAERFIRTLLGGWAYGAIYGSSQERRQALAGWLDFYNRRRPHGSLSHQPPLTRLEALRRNNPAGSYS